MSRILCWFSCGATSAVATKMTIEKYPDLDVQPVYTNPGGEHEDAERFLADCEAWFGKKVTVLRSEEYADPWEVYEKTGWLVGPAGVRCSAELKKKLRFKFQNAAEDLQIFGFDMGELKRAERFRAANHDIRVEFPLIDARKTKADCIRVLQSVGIPLPAMYLLGYPNANCVGCPRGQAFYWNKIRVDFPAVFERMSKVERKMDVAICKTYKGAADREEGDKRQRVFLDELDPDAGRADPENDFSCGVGCEVQGEMAFD